MSERPFLIERLKQRALVKWGLGYLAAAWLLLQVLGFLAGAFHWPDAVVRVSTVFAASGLLAVLTAAWFHAERGHQRITSLEGGLFAAIAGVAVVGGFMVAGPPAPAAEPDAQAAAASEDRSLAVLPFVDLSPSRDQAYFADGVTEELLNALARVPGLRVAGRTSSFRFRGEGLDLQEVGSQLGVASVLEGSVGRDGDRLRVRVRLVDAARGHQLWGDTYDRVLTDVFAVQEGIAREVVAALQVRLGAVPGGRLVRGQTADPEAFELYLKGRHLWNQRTGPSLTAALRHFEEAIAVDSMFALAHAALADTYLLLPEYAGGRTRDVAPQVVAAAVRAIELDPSLAEPYVTLGSLYQRSWQWEESERAFRRALELEPGSALAHLRYSILLKNQGRFPEAVEALRHARRSDPLSLNVGWNLTHALGLVGDHDAAVAEARQMLELDAGSPRGYGALGTAYAIAGRYSEAIEPLERAEELAENGGPGNWLAISYAGVGRLEDARAIRDRLIATQGGTEMRPFNVASAHVALGEIDEAFRVLERAERERNGMLGRVGWWRGVPAYRAVTRDPRYTRLLDRIGLPH